MAQANTSGAPALTFQSTIFDVVVRDGQPWIRANQIGLALEYKNPELSIAKLYRANQEEFTDRMTAVVKLDSAGGAQDTRLFSLRGAHLLAMFARTAKAAEFRRWVLDVLDREMEQPAPAPVSRLALTGAAQLGAEVQAGALARLAGDEWLESGRWLLSFVHDEYRPGEYRPHVKRLEAGTFVTTWRRLAENISDPAMMLNADDLGLLARACLDELERRAAHARQLEIAAHRARTAASAKPGQLPQPPRQQRLA